VKAAEATECAGQQGQFWPMHDVLFKNPKQFAEPQLVTYAQALQLDSAAFGRCLQGATTDKVRADAAAASALGITGTPAFLVGTIQPDGRAKITERIVGARPLSSFEIALDKVLESSAGTR
jgi:protein-disulfide isomerase